MEFSRQEYWSGLPFLPPGDCPDPGIKPRSPALQADSLPSESPEKPITAIYRKLIFYGRRKMILIQLMISVRMEQALDYLEFRVT